MTTQAYPDDDADGIEFEPGDANEALPQSLQPDIQALPAAVAKSDGERKEHYFEIVAQMMRDGVLKEGPDYGVIPGTSKPTLLKPGAQKIMSRCGLASKLLNVHREWTSDRLFYEIVVGMLNKDTGMNEGEGIGLCSSAERKYSTQAVDNIANTVLKMAKKRALIDAVLDATGCSDLFTQDLEDLEANGVLQGAPTAQEPRQQTARPSGGGQYEQRDCPICGGEMWDNRARKTNPRAPDFKCKNAPPKGDCQGVIWPPRDDRANGSERSNAALDRGYDNAMRQDEDEMDVPVAPQVDPEQLDSLRAVVSEFYNGRGDADEKLYAYTMKNYGVKPDHLTGQQATAIARAFVKATNDRKNAAQKAPA